MTRYDPFSYGQVPLGHKEPPAAAPDDLLFAAPTPTRSALPASDWDPPAENAFSAASTTGNTDETLAFGQDILGESVPAPSKPAASKPAAAKPATAKPAGAKPAPAKLAAPEAPLPAARPNVAAPVPAPAKPAETAPRRGPQPVLMPMRTTTAGIATAVSIVGTGGSVAAWLLIQQQNPVMAAILGAASLVGAAMAWLMLRR